MDNKLDQPADDKVEVSWTYIFRMRLTLSPDPA